MNTPSAALAAAGADDEAPADEEGAAEPVSLSLLPQAARARALTLITASDRHVRKG
ncbi:MAG TPA: hypothetical protein VFR07_05685 [Mycobacteriales bacterium]|nr:hypothetical protein [Mycobacteriales bacterium]